MSRLVEIKKRLPKYERKGPVIDSVLSPGAEEIQTLANRLTEILDQLFVPTATNEGLSLREEDVGIKVDPSKPIDQRRSRILAKLRGHGTVTVALVKSVAEAHAYGEVEIGEDIENYMITITFVSTRGVPPNMADVEAAIEEIKPAHLGVAYVFLYNQYGDLVGYTHDQLSAFTHEEIRASVLP